MNKKAYIYGFISFIVLFFIFNPIIEKKPALADESSNLQILKNDVSQDGVIKEESQDVYNMSETYLKDYTKNSSKELEVEIVDVVDGQLILLAINGTDKPIKNLRFDMTAKNLFKDKQIESKQSASGTLEAGKIYPIKVDLTAEELNNFEENEPFTSVELNNIKIEYVNQANFWKYYVLNLIFSVIAYKLGFARELPFKKEIFVYIMLAIGVFILTIFNLLGLPITESLIITSLVLAIYRYRLHLTRKKEAQETH